MQQRLATEYIPNSVPANDDITPLIEVFQENIVNNSRTSILPYQASYYRYLWCDCLAAMVFEQLKEEYESSSLTSSSMSSSEEEEAKINVKDDTNKPNENQADAIQKMRDRVQSSILRRGAALEVEFDSFLREFNIGDKFSIIPDALFRRYGLQQEDVSSNESIAPP
jgi:hypothetical protein